MPSTEVIFFAAEAGSVPVLQWLDRMPLTLRNCKVIMQATFGSARRMQLHMVSRSHGGRGAYVSSAGWEGGVCIIAGKGR